MITSALGRLAAGDNLSLDEMTGVIDQVMQGGVPEGEIAVLLTALKHKGETVDEIAGAALAMRRHMTPIRTTRTGLVDTCGTGGDASGTFNISTAAAIVAAAAGVPVAKHGNRSITSKSGSADVLSALGVNIEAPVPVVERCLNELGICFCFARTHPAMKRRAGAKEAGRPTISICSARSAIQPARHFRYWEWGRSSCTRRWPTCWRGSAPSGRWSFTVPAVWTKSRSTGQPT
jgi:anthranilate phosphoribosyltransferase